MEPHSIIFHHCYSDIQQLTESLITTHDPNLAVPPRSPQINFKFSCNTFISDWVIYEDVSPQPDLLTEFPIAPSEAVISVGCDELFCHENACEIIARVIKNLPVTGTSRQEQEVVEFALLQAREAVFTTPRDHNVVHFHISVTVVHKNFFVGRPSPFRQMARRLMEEDEFISIGRGEDSSIESPDFDDWVIRQSTDVDEVRMVPAEDSSIKSLERKRVQTADSGACTICLDEFDAGCEAVCMPCSHFFHEDCITKWLRTSHYCPICRFEMRTS